MPTMAPFDPVALLIIAVCNPAVIIVGLLMGRAADQAQKIVIAGFVAALAGSVLVWLAARFGVLPARGVGGEAGLFVLQFLLGMGWSAAAYFWVAQNSKPDET